MEILFDRRDTVFVVTFNRPDKGNAYTPLMAKLLSDKLKAISEDRSIRAVLVCGKGEHFMNGHDRDMYADNASAVQEQIYQKVQFFNNTVRELQLMERPVVVAVKGRVSGAGLSLMLACDLVVSADTTIFNSDFAPHAMMPDGGVAFFMARKIGAARATEILMLSEDFSAEKAEKWGLINRIVPAESLEAASTAWAEKLATGATRTLGMTKRLLSKAFEQDLNAHLGIESACVTANTKTFDFHEARKALAAQRDPKFIGA